MNANIDPPRTPLPGAVLALAEAALQRQSSLLVTARTGATSTRSLEPATPQGATGAPAPTVPDRLSLSPQALQALVAPPSAPGTGPAATAPHAATRLQPPLAASAPASPLRPQTASTAVQPPAAWPTAGVDAPVRSLLGAIVQQMTLGSLPQRVVSVQPWPAELVRQLALPPDPGSGEQDSALPLLQTWLVRQGSMQTAEGPRAFTLTLKVPVQWLQQQPAPAPAPPPGGSLSLTFAGSPQVLQAGAFALVLQSPETQTRTSALLALEFAPLAQATVYGRDMLQARQDPWLQMAVLQASGHLPRDEDLARDQEAGLCQTPGCPYAGQAPCAQPFCLALRVVTPVAAVEAQDGGAAP